VFWSGNICTNCWRFSSTC